jgi:fructose-bisphosphate aldolase class I
MTDLSDIAQALCSPGKGLLAADESTATADKRLASYGIASTEEMRRAFRDLFLSTPGVEEYVSGVILYEETLSQNANSGVLFPALLAQHGIIPGIKVDQGTEPFPESPQELITKGLLGLGERLAAFRADYGTGFTKWRAVIRIDGDRLPSAQALVENAKRLALYACEAQRAGMVPIVEPEVLIDGNHSRARAKDVLAVTLKTVIDALVEQGADLSGVIVKTAMAISGSDTARQDTPEEVAADTVAVLMRTVPEAIGGVVFLSGGQTPDQATDNLRAIAQQAAAQNAPWPLTFSYARALQEEALAAWGGKPENVDAGRAAFLARLKAVSNAARGL